MEQENNANSFENNEQPIIEKVEENQPIEEKKSKSCPFRPSTVMNAFFFLAIVGLYLLYFFGGKHVSDGKSGNITGSLKIAYFNTDSVFQSYLLVNDLRNELKTEKEKLESNFNSRQAAFEQKVKNYQANVQSNAINAVQAQNGEKQLMKEREEIMQMNEQYTQQLSAKEMEINKVITESIIEYSQKYNKTYGADYILGYTKGGPIIVVNEKMDITKDIIEGLNKEYNENKAKK